jgi:hypothetical protein
MKKNLSDHEYIEKLNALYLNGNRDEAHLNNYWTAMERAVSGRVAFEIIRRFEKGEAVAEKYDLGKLRSECGGLPVSIEKISKVVWIPCTYKQSLAKFNDPINKSFEIFDKDELNAFLLGNGYEENKTIIEKVLYCNDQAGNKIGKKLNLFFEDASWRADAKVYSRVLLEHMNSFYSNPIYIAEMNKGDDYKRFIESLNGIIRITSMYLSEMK